MCGKNNKFVFSLKTLIFYRARIVSSPVTLFTTSVRVLRAVLNIIKGKQ